MTLGTVLLLSALFLVLHNVREDRQSGEEAQQIMSVLKDEIPAYTEPAETMVTGEVYDLYEAYETTEPQEMPTVEINGNVYIGYVAIPELGVELPVQSEWSYPGLKISPCRYQGNVYEDNLILCAHNYTTHFGRIRNLHTDSEIIFTDADGREYVYSVVNIEELPGTAVEELQFSNADDWDLTLFTCTISGQSRVTVRAVRETE